MHSSHAQANGIVSVLASYRLSAWADRGGKPRRFALVVGVVALCAAALAPAVVRSALPAV